MQGDAGEHTPTVPDAVRDPGRLILLDACCLLSLAATGSMEEILRSTPARFGVAEAAAAEALFLRRGGDSDDADERDLLDLEPLIDAGLVRVLHLESNDEAASFVHYAADLDDGEAMTCALADRRGAEVATDDRKAIWVLATRAPHVPRHTTTSLLHHWATNQGISSPRLARILVDIQERARFVPGKRDPLWIWWENAIRSLA